MADALRWRRGTAFRNRLVGGHPLMAMHTDRLRRSRRAFFVMIMVLALPVLSGCAGTVQTPEERAEDDHQSRLAQLMRIAETTRAGGDLAAAASLYHRAHVLAPDNPAPLVAFGETAAAMGEVNRAAKAYRSAVSLNPENQRARFGYGKALIALNRPGRAADQFTTIIELEPGNHRAYNGLGVALDLAGRHEQAQQRYLDGLEKAPDDLAMRNNLALSIALNGEYEEAVTTLRDLASDPVVGPKARRNLALVYALAGANEQAAAVARADLKEWQVQNNLVYYGLLRELSGRELAAAVFGVKNGIDDFAMDIAPASGSFAPE